MDCAAGRVVETPTEARGAKLLASCDRTPSARAILVEAHLAVPIARRRADGRGCWAGRCLSCPSSSSTRAACSSASLSAAARRSHCGAARSRGAASRVTVASGRSNATAWHSGRAAAHPRAAATTVAPNGVARSAAGQPHLRGARGACSSRPLWVTLRASARSAQRQHDNDRDQTEPSTCRDPLRSTIPSLKRMHLAGVSRFKHRTGA